MYVVENKHYSESVLCCKPTSCYSTDVNTVGHVVTLHESIHSHCSWLDRLRDMELLRILLMFIVHAALWLGM
jgi:hypothetical protein